MEAKKINIRNRVNVVWTLFLLFIIQNAYADFCTEGDSTKIKYDINDPQNPDCPCHKYQKIADKEYAALIKLQNKNAGQYSRNLSPTFHSTEGKTLNGIRSYRKNKIRTKSGINFIKNKSYKRDKTFDSLKRIFGINRWYVWKRRPDPASCFKWK